MEQYSAAARKSSGIFEYENTKEKKVRARQTEILKKLCTVRDKMPKATMHGAGTSTDT